MMSEHDVQLKFSLALIQVLCSGVSYCDEWYATYGKVWPAEPI